jgi:HSP20 family molecular chaperone IbpA
VFLSEDKSDLVFEFALAGYDKEKVKVSAGTNSITVKGEPIEVKSQNLIHRGVSRRDVNFSLSLDDRLNPQKSKVKFDNGMLSIKVPLREDAKEIDLF